MKKSVTVYLAFILVLTACFGGKKDRISIKGSTTILPIVQKAAEQFRKSNTAVISIEGNGSENGITALFESSCDIAMSSYHISPQKFQEAAEKGLKLRELIIAYDMIIPVVNPANTVDNLTKEQLKNIYGGKISSWKELGWVDAEIMIISRDSFSGTLTVWNEKVMSGQAIAAAAFIEDSNKRVVNTVSDNLHAIGYIACAYLNNRLKPVKIENIAADVKNAYSGEYPLTRELFIYFNEGSISKKAEKFAFFLITDEGQQCAVKAGYIPLKV